MADSDTAVELAAAASLSTVFSRAFGMTSFRARGYQARVLVSTIAGRNVVTVDPPGAGKTLTFVGTTLARPLDWCSRRIRKGHAKARPAAT